MIHAFIIPGFTDPSFDAWLDTSSALIEQYCAAVHGDDFEGRVRDAACLCVVADHLWRERGDGEPSWASLDVETLVAELLIPEGQAALISVLVAFVTFLCQRSAIGPLATVKLLGDLERVAAAIGAPRDIDGTRRWQSLAQA